MPPLAPLPCQSTLPNRSAHARLAARTPRTNVNFDDHDWDSAEPTAPAAQDGSTAWKVTAGVVAGVVLGGTLVYAIEHYMPGLALHETAQVFGQAMREGSQRSAPEPAPPLRDSTAPQAVAAPLEGQLLQAQAAPPSAGVVAPAPLLRVANERNPDLGTVAARADLSRKAQAWAEHYQKPRHCLENPSADTLVDCANHYIRARREFDAAFEAGAR